MITSFEDFIAPLSQNQRDISLRLRELLMQAAPEMMEKIQYKQAPFYFRYGRIFYLWPYAGDAMELGFCRGCDHSNSHGLLDSRGRKEVSSIIFSEAARVSLDDNALIETIQEALVLDEWRRRKYRYR